MGHAACIRCGENLSRCIHSPESDRIIARATYCLVSEYSSTVKKYGYVDEDVLGNTAAIPGSPTSIETAHISKIYLDLGSNVTTVERV